MGVFYFWCQLVLHIVSVHELFEGVITYIVEALIPWLQESYDRCLFVDYFTGRARKYRYKEANCLYTFWDVDGALLEVLLKLDDE